ncbi:MAG: Asp-tRNA(Asn)/Glu-tRNA(Gln) amidotransferase subunit GatC [Candidatus Promineifilaceae bacterium]
MKLTLEDVEKIAGLVRLELTAAEKARFQGQLSAVLDYAARLDELELDGVAPAGSGAALENVLRPDEVEPCLPLEEVLFNAARSTAGQFLIQPVFDPAAGSR